MFQEIFYRPLYNGLIYLFHIVPMADAGVVIVLFTIIIKFILFPLSIKSTKSQMEMKSIEKDLKEIKEKYKDNKDEYTKKTIELYKERNINPFSGFFVLLIQLPIIIALYQVFLKSGLPVINKALLYSFVFVPDVVNMKFLNLIDISQKSIILAVLAGFTTYLQIKYSSLDTKDDVNNKKPDTSTPEFMVLMQKQMKFTFPILVLFISWSVSAAISIYWVTSNVFTILQEIYIRKHIKDKFNS
jgi:YidC/Oxa1 family membrane protein insertase